MGIWEPDAIGWLALAIVLLAGVSKGTTGLGAPVVATPLLAVLYGDLPLAIAVMIAPTIITDVMLLARHMEHFREARRLAGFVLLGLVGIVLGTSLLVALDDDVLKLALGVIITVFVVTSWTNRLPVLDGKAGRVAGPPLGLVAGLFQGGAGVSGPLITMYLFSLHLSRGAFLFAINAIFLFLDTAQVIALQRAGVYSADAAVLAAVAAVPLCVGVLLGFRLRPHVTDRRFRQGILALMTLTAVTLIWQSLSRL